MKIKHSSPQSTYISDSQFTIQTKNLSFIYKHQDERILNEINLNIKKNQFILLCGSTGSGKTTLIRSFNGLIPHFYHGKFFGYVFINEKDTVNIKSPAELSSQIGTIFQIPENQLFTMTVERELLFALENMNFSREEMKKRINRAIELTHIESLIQKAPFELSGGEQQKVALASVLALDPEIFILDEPLSNLDPKSATEMTALLFDLYKNHNKTIILSEHRIKYLLPYLNEVILINDGKILLHEDIQKALLGTALFDHNLDLSTLIYWIKSHLKKEDKVFPLNSSAQTTFFKEIISKFTTNINVILQNQSHPLSNTKSVIEFQDVSFSYNPDHDNSNQILQNLSFSIPEGEIIGILGPNGAGKTTLMKLITGLLTPTSGSILIEQKNINEWGIENIVNHVGLVFQNPDHQLFSNTVEEELEFSLKNLDLSKDEQKERVNTTLQDFEIEKFRESSPFNLSGGQRKKVSTASILIRKTQILIFDEPTIGQDKKQKENLHKKIQTLQKSGHTILIVSHDMEFIAELATRLIVLKKGKIEGIGATQKILNDLDLITSCALEQPPVQQLLRNIFKDNEIFTINQLNKLLKEEGEKQ